MAHLEPLFDGRGARARVAIPRSGPLLALIVLALTVGAGTASAEQDDEDYPHGEFAGDCSLCHSAEAWSPLQLSADFEHASFGFPHGFPLEGAHQQTECRACHVNLDFTKSESECADCHQDVHRGEMGNDCSSCHNTRSFVSRNEMAREHQMTRFPLTGAHRALDCTSCHTSARGGNLVWALPLDCVACHQSAFDSATDPNHKQGGFPADCVQCHSTSAWDGARVNHNQTEFPLTGAHGALTCQNCHADGVYDGKPTDCVSCHQSDYDETIDPNHAQAGYSTDCTACHDTATWTGAEFDHGQTEFPLTGAHGALTCQNCHADGVYDGKPIDCVSCHQSDYDETIDPNHAQAGFATTCNDCHDTTTWTSGAYDHGQTSFPLTGAHGTLICQDCHSDGVYAGKPIDCVSCHQSDYDGTVDPNHAQAGYTTDCTICHDTATWTGAEFDHGQTEFPLTGAHGALTCQNCHADGVYDGKPIDCVSCHQSDYDETIDPNHAQAGFATTCNDCHDTTTWTSGAYDHGQTSFPLTGAHGTLICQDCHSDGVYAGKPIDCVSCHQSDYDGTVDPNHAQAGFATTCNDCHATTIWTSGAYNHDQTSFPLTGSHRTVRCLDCHSDGVYVGKSIECVSCHQGDYDQTIDPNHAASGFSTDCASCHDTSSWNNAEFDHDALFFPIYSGKHLGKWDVCSDCHVNPNNYAAFECINCHKHDDEAHVTDQHSGVGGFSYDSQACYSCHPDGRD